MASYHSEFIDWNLIFRTKKKKVDVLFPKGIKTFFSFMAIESKCLMCCVSTFHSGFQFQGNSELRGEKKSQSGCLSVLECSLMFYREHSADPGGRKKIYPSFLKLPCPLSQTDFLK